MRTFATIGIHALALMVMTAAPATAQTHWTVAPEGNEARYLVREQLAGFEFPNDAVGVTSAITGGITIGADGAVTVEGSRIEIELASLKSDQDRRDNYLRRNTLETETYPRAVFVPTAIRGLSLPANGSGEATFELVGDLTVKEVTRPVTWTVTAQYGEGTISGKAATQFTFDDMGLTKPRLARLLSVADEIRLEYDFRLVQDGHAH